VIEEAAPMAGRMMITARIAEARLTAVTDVTGAPPRYGETVTLSLPDRPAFVYATTGERIG
jgi:hypothetical protein